MYKKGQTIKFEEEKNIFVKVSWAFLKVKGTVHDFSFSVYFTVNFQLGVWDGLNIGFMFCLVYLNIRFDKFFEEMASNAKKKKSHIDKIYSY